MAQEFEASRVDGGAVTRRYIAVIDKDPDSDYWVWFPDVPGCFSAGKTLQDVHVMAKEAIELHLAEDGEAAPESSNLDAFFADPKNNDASIFVVNAEIVPPRSLSSLRFAGGREPDPTYVAQRKEDGKFEVKEQRFGQWGSAIGTIYRRLLQALRPQKYSGSSERGDYVLSKNIKENILKHCDIQGPCGPLSLPL